MINAISSCKALLMLLMLLLLDAGKISAQLLETEKRWALSYTGGAWVKPVLTDNPSGQPSERRSEAVAITGEYYLPKKWNIQAGYFRTDINYSDVSRTMEGFQAGVKKYFIDQDFPIQPYLSAAGQFNWSRHREIEDFMYDNYGRKQFTRNPRFSFFPGAGFELYLFSSVAFVAEYQFHIGLDSRTEFTVWPDGKNSYSMKDQGMYHNLQLGVKLTFPFQFTGSDAKNLFTIIFEMLDTAIDQRLKEKNHRYY